MFLIIAVEELVAGPLTSYRADLVFSNESREFSSELVRRDVIETPFTFQLLCNVPIGIWY